MGWLYCTSGNAFFMLNGIAAMVRERNGAFEAFDLTSEEWSPVNQPYSPLAIGAYATLALAQAAVEARFSVGAGIRI